MITLLELFNETKGTTFRYFKNFDKIGLIDFESLPMLCQSTLAL